MAFWGIITLACATSIFAEAKWYQHPKREATTTICDHVYNNTNDVQCYCVGSQTKDMVRSASCHLIKKDVQPDDRSWNNFETLKDINKLTLTNTGGIALSYIPTNALKFMPKILKIDIKYGNIEKIYAFAFANLSLIEEIMLSDNQIQTIGVNAFAHHRDLTTIGLDTNNIVEINRDVFVDLPSLEKLFLTSNKITTIHDRAFVHLINLVELEVDRNGLFSLNSETFSGLKNLQKLDLSGNSLEVIGDNTFLPLVNLKTLNLEDNKIQMLDEKAFSGLGKLKALNLAHNKLTTIENVKTFGGLESLTLLSLKSNQLIELKTQVMSPILKNFYGNTSSLDVEDNNFPCDCRLDWFMSLMNKTKNSNLRLAMENLKCIPDANLRELWTKALETEKNGAQASVDEDTEVQNTDYEYYDEDQLNGKLFYIDVRDLANCTKATFYRLPITDNVGHKAQETETTKLTTKAISSPVTTPKTTHKTEPNTLQFTTAKVLYDEAPRMTEIKTNKLIKDNASKSNDSFTTVRLATVSAKPLEEHNIYNQNMASDEARPEKIKAHRSIQEELKNTPKTNHNNTCRNGNSVALLSIMFCIRLYFY